MKKTTVKMLRRRLDDTQAVMLARSGSARELARSEWRTAYARYLAALRLYLRQNGTVVIGYPNYRI